MSNLYEWEEVATSNPLSYRMPIPGGWLYRIDHISADGYGGIVWSSVVFVPEVRP